MPDRPHGSRTCVVLGAHGRELAGGLADGPGGVVAVRATPRLALGDSRVRQDGEASWQMEAGTGDHASVAAPPAAVAVADAVERLGLDDVVLVCASPAWAGLGHLLRARRGWPVIVIAGEARAADRLGEDGLVATADGVVACDSPVVRRWAGRTANLVTGTARADAVRAAIGMIGPVSLADVRQRAVRALLADRHAVVVVGPREPVGTLHGDGTPRPAGRPVDAVLVTAADRPALEEGLARAEAAGLDEVHVLLAAGALPPGEGDLAARAAALLADAGLVVVHLSRVMWPSPRDARPTGGAGRRQRIDAETAELLAVCAPRGRPAAALGALEAEMAALRTRVDVLAQLQIERSLTHLDEVLRERRIVELDARVNELLDQVRRLESELA